eukprot:5497198-Amphidinium_carterae.1
MPRFGAMLARHLHYMLWMEDDPTAATRATDYGYAEPFRHHLYVTADVRHSTTSADKHRKNNKELPNIVVSSKRHATKFSLFQLGENSAPSATPSATP